MTAAVLPRELPTHAQALATRLSTEYGDGITADTVVDVVRSCYAPLAEARITGYVPTLLEKSSRERLRRLRAARTLSAAAG
ncbi:MAG TPA: hypothetical protein VLR26_18695 [Frankiaceae bacterium]|nr:hypothetical protein [Frankiaceae bacterium]